jgi:hypothetical protein
VEILQANADDIRRLFGWGKRLVDTAVRQPPYSTSGRLSGSPPA